MRYRILLHLLLGMPAMLSAQSQLTGTVTEANGSPLPYANVRLLLEKDSSLVAGSISEVDGSFRFDRVAADDYLLSITSVGFRAYLHKIRVPRDEGLIVPSIVLMEGEDELAEVVVAAQKPLYEKQMDRMVINVQESITAAGSSVLEVLSRSPGVMVNQQQNSIALNGREGVMVMINNTLSRIPMASLMQMLEGMSAANVEKIELITQPPSNLDAEGAGGIIHIVTKESADFGTNGTFGLNAGTKRAEVYGANLSLAHRGKSFSVFAEYAFFHTHNVLLWQNAFRSESQSGLLKSFQSDTDRAILTRSHQFRVGTQKTFDKNSEIGAYINLTQINNSMRGEGGTILQVADSLVRTDILYHESRDISNQSSHIHYSFKPWAKHTFRIDYDWVTLQLDNLSTYDNAAYFAEQSEAIQFDLESYAPMNFHIAALDYQFQPAEGIHLKAGAKRSWMDFDNSIQSTYDENGVGELGAILTGSAHVQEIVSAAYIGGDWRAGNKLAFKVGLRYEHTLTDIENGNEKGDINRNYANLFPSLLIQKNLNENTAMALGYYRRITRPSLGNLVPVVLLINQNTQFDGNAALLPSLIDTYKLELTYKRASVALEHSYTEDAIAPFQPSYDPKNELITFSPQNLRFLQSTGLLFSAPWIITTTWDLQSSLQLNRRSFETAHLPVNQRNAFFDLNLNLTNTFLLGNGYMAEVGGNFESRRNWGLLIFRPVGALNLGVQKKLVGDKGTIRLAITDVLNTNNLLNGMVFREPPLHMQNDYYLRNRTFMLSYSRSFGNKKLKAVKVESTSEEDRKRMDVR